MQIIENDVDINSAAIFEEFQLRKVVDDEGDICYYNQNNVHHRVFGPAIIAADGRRYRYQNGKLHRIDGPAAIYPRDNNCYFLFGKHYQEQEYWKKVERLKNGNR